MQWSSSVSTITPSQSNKRAYFGFDERAAIALTLALEGVFRAYTCLVEMHKTEYKEQQRVFVYRNMYCFTVLLNQGDA